MPELPSLPPQLVASTISEIGWRVRRAWFASGNSCAISSVARSTALRTPPLSWIVTIGGRPSARSGSVILWRSTMGAAWFTSQPRPITT